MFSFEGVEEGSSPATRVSSLLPSAPSSNYLHPGTLFGSSLHPVASSGVASNEGGERRRKQEFFVSCTCSVTTLPRCVAGSLELQKT